MKIIKLLIVTSLSVYTLSAFAIKPGDEVIVDQKRSEINVRSVAGKTGKNLYQVSSGQKGMVLDGPVNKDGYIWFLVDWDDSDVQLVHGWTALGEDWYTGNGKTLISKLSFLQNLSESFFLNRPVKIESEEEYSDSVLEKYNTEREQGFKSLDRANKNLGKALKAMEEKNYTNAYMEYKYSVVHLSNTKQSFNLASKALRR